ELALELTDEVIEDAPAADLVPAAEIIPLVRPEPPLAAAAEPVRLSDFHVAPSTGEADAEEGERPLTLFEKMMNLSRGPAKPKAAKAEPAPAARTPAGEDPLEIPQFFKRQVND
ncbi:MAG: hypothetical protein INF91_02220, partial [Alphaproteobacteria bacterium]|nr:hypothetical protein [Alphaproteobacteria bacterium]